MPSTPAPPEPSSPATAPDPLDRISWPVTTARLTLRRAGEADVEPTWQFRRLPEVNRWLTSQPADLDEYRTKFLEPGRLARTLVVEHEGRVVGDLMLGVGDGWAQSEVAERAAGTKADLGWVIAPGSGGRGLATEAVLELLRLAFEDLGVRRVEAVCFADNTPSWRLMERVGMRREVHTVADSLHASGEWLDGFGYALLAEEWRDRRRRPAEPDANDPKATLHRYLRDARKAVLWKLRGTSEYDARRPLTPTGTNLLGLVKHLASIEAGYLGDTFGRPFPQHLPWMDDDAEVNADMWATAEESREDVVDLYRRVQAHGDATIAALELDARGQVPWWPADRREVSLHRILVHLVTETERHAGHADIVRELVDGAVGLLEDRDNMAPGDSAWWTSYRERLERVARESEHR